jgi:hypothetical protein
MQTHYNETSMNHKIKIKLPSLNFKQGSFY